MKSNEEILEDFPFGNEVIPAMIEAQVEILHEAVKQWTVHKIAFMNGQEGFKSIDEIILKIKREIEG